MIAVINCGIRTRKRGGPPRALRSTMAMLATMALLCSVGADRDGRPMLSSSR